MIKLVTAFISFPETNAIYMFCLAQVISMS